MTMLFHSSEKVKMEGKKRQIEGNKTTVIFCQKKPAAFIGINVKQTRSTPMLYRILPDADNQTLTTKSFVVPRIRKQLGLYWILRKTHGKIPSCLTICSSYVCHKFSSLPLRCMLRSSCFYPERRKAIHLHWIFQLTTPLDPYLV